MSITLMNEAMACAWDKHSKPSFKVQSEKDAWWLGAFEVPKETHEVLAWIFDRTPWITEVIRKQIDGQLLDVENKGKFKVDWHLGGDLKTIKCMLGCAQGALTKFPCPYCTAQIDTSKNKKSTKKGKKQKQDKDQSKSSDDEAETHIPSKTKRSRKGRNVASKVTKKGKAQQEDKDESESSDDEDEHQANVKWADGAMSPNMLEEPNRDSNWNPIIKFPLKNIHFCTLHAFMRIFDRLLKCHIDYAFTMPTQERKVTAIGKVEDLLNSLGCHGGNVKIEVNKQASGMSHEVAQQVSMTGAKARRFLEKPASIDNSKKTWGLWRQLCAITTDVDCPLPTLVNIRKQLWINFNKMVRLMNQSSTTAQERAAFQQHIVDFTQNLIESWGESKVTHYMVGSSPMTNTLYFLNYFS